MGFIRQQGSAAVDAAGALLYQVSGLQVCQMKLDSQRVFVERIADGVAAAAHRVVEAAHVPTDGDGLHGFRRMKRSMR